MTETYISENALCMAFVKTLADYKAYGLMRDVIYFHIPNEVARPNGDNDKFYAIMGKRLNDMGRLAGVSDYVFIWLGDDGLQVAFLEAKNGNKPLQQTQKDFFTACHRHNIRTGIFRTVSEAFDILSAWGIIKADKRK